MGFNPNLSPRHYKHNPYVTPYMFTMLYFQQTLRTKAINPERSNQKIYMYFIYYNEINL